MGKKTLARQSGFYTRFFCFVLFCFVFGWFVVVVVFNPISARVKPNVPFTSAVSWLKQIW